MNEKKLDKLCKKYVRDKNKENKRKRPSYDWGEFLGSSLFVILWIDGIALCLILLLIAAFLTGG